MRKKLINVINMIKSNKRYKYTLIVTVMLLFISIIGYSLSFFNKNNDSVLTTNIRINNLSYNITTNSGTSDDRILHLKSLKTESFTVIITNLNNIDTKYELIYEICTDLNCTNILDELPEDIEIGLNPSLPSNANGDIAASESATVNILTENNSTDDYYIKLNLNAGYIWNDLALVNQLDYFSKSTSIIAYEDGIEINGYPEGCYHNATIKGFIGNSEVELENKSITCNTNTKKWSLSYTGFASKLNIYFEKKPLKQYITELDLTTNGLEIDPTDDTNLRYVGANPKNYLEFNGETWRIIGIFNNMISIDEQGNEKTETLIKLIRDESLGNYSWDTSETSINTGYGINEWSQADLMTELNIDYLDTSKTSGTTLWYNGENNEKSRTYDYSQNIKTSSIDKIAKVRWNLGGYTTPSVSALTIYNAERGTLNISNPQDGVPRTTTWDGKVALLYPSDYGFASTNAECRNILDSSINDVFNCINDNWLANDTFYWTLTPRSGNEYRVFRIRANGDIYRSPAYNLFGVRPTIFLKSDVAIKGGNGIAEDPYTISVDSPFINDSWETIANNVRNGNASLYNVGDIKKINIDGTDYRVRVANNTTPSECGTDDFSETACGFVIEFVDIVEKRIMINAETNAGGWPITEIRTYLNGDFLNKLPIDLQREIIDTIVISGHGNTSGESNFTTTDKIYLLSGHEVWEDTSQSTTSLSTRDTAYNNTRQLDYYKSQNVTTDSYSGAIKKYEGSDSIWWLRSARSANSTGFLRANKYGEWGSGGVSYSYGVSPAFRIG